MAPLVKTYPRYLCDGRLYAFSKFEISCVSCGRKYNSKSHAYNHAISQQCVQPHGGNNGKEAVAPNEMVAGRNESPQQQAPVAAGPSVVDVDRRTHVERLTGNMAGHKALTVDVYAIGPNLGDVGHKLATRKKFEKNGTLAGLLGSLTGDNDVKIIKCKCGIEELAELFQLLGADVFKFSSVEETEQFLETVLNSDDPELFVNSNTGGPARVLEVNMPLQNVKIIRTMIVVYSRDLHLGGARLHDGRPSGSPEPLGAQPANTTIMKKGAPPAKAVAVVTGVTCKSGASVISRTANAAGAVMPGTCSKTQIPLGVVLNRLNVPAGSAPADAVAAALYYIKRGFNEHKGVLQLAVNMLPPAEDGLGPIRQKDMTPELQTGHGSQATDKFPRNVTDGDRQRGKLLQTCLIAATGAAVEQMLAADSSFPFLLLHQTAGHLSSDTKYSVPPSSSSRTQCPTDVQHLIRKRSLDIVGPALSKGRVLSLEELAAHNLVISGWEAKEANLRAADSVLSPYKHVFNDKIELQLEENVADAILRRHILIGLSQDTTWETSVKILLKDGVNIHPAAVKAFGPKQAFGPVSRVGAAVAPPPQDTRPQRTLRPWATDVGSGGSLQQP
ncbi:hypothetical protein VOLCADRAFT_104821 [Volvox carteri f. nagariensis]|uniref:Uncharacterized protein n=1 Tax=Volvox carteri f. nagariensis TaxID=3068 RepID=D8TWA3_VOLCA|nr:uncharacterized protein VOLCADRAFT_104821 [Volvox carteri f. nagariensis]EFJ48440.1 hypothetical protein VOLCADRAFT_104821 [Volvox carteri f. nagariensis]|eukprot:XP_002950694.1 hypothetical protein VOLCADRAFT_104821 [Volvox carteri f. nagariensis]